jgi:hypothetical protein
VIGCSPDDSPEDSKRQQTRQSNRSRELAATGGGAEPGR